MFEDHAKTEREVNALRELSIRSSVAGALAHRHSSGSNRASYLKKSEQFSWDAYQLRQLMMSSGGGDKSKAVSLRAIHLQVESHTSVRTIRRASAVCHRKDQDDAVDMDIDVHREAAVDDEHLPDDVSSEESLDDIPLSQRSRRIQVSGKRKK